MCVVGEWLVFVEYIFVELFVGVKFGQVWFVVVFVEDVYVVWVVFVFIEVEIDCEKFWEVVVRYVWYDWCWEFYGLFFGQYDVECEVKFVYGFVLKLVVEVIQCGFGFCVEEDVVGVGVEVVDVGDVVVVFFVDECYEIFVFFVLLVGCDQQVVWFVECDYGFVFVDNRRQGYSGRVRVGFVVW